jgi:serine/threonine-protein kinase
MAELVADLDDWAAGREPAAPRLTRWRRLRRWVVRNRRAAAAAAALAAAATGLVGAGRALAPVPPVPPVPPADVTPDEVRGPDGRRLPFRVRLGHDKSKVSVAADGTLTVSSWGLCLVEYTPAGPRPERYHFAARVRHERSDLSGQVGVYFAHRAEPGPYGDRHLFGRVSYNDLLSPADKVQAAARPVPVPIRPALENRARIGLIAVLPGPSGQWSGADWFAADRPFRVAGSVADRWRAVGVTAAADGASGAWEGEPFGHIPAARLAGAFASELDRARRLAPAHPPPAAAEYDPAGGVGLYVEQSSASFREVAVTAADARGLLP